MSIRSCIYMIITLMGLAQAGHAQQGDTVYNFVRASRVIFEDAPFSEEEGSLPASWVSAGSSGAGFIAMDGDVPVIRYVAGKGLFAKARITDPSPACKYITFECDVKLEDSVMGKFTVAFNADGYKAERHYSLEYNWLPQEWIPQTKEHWFMTPISEVFGMGRFHYNEWHHIAICFMATGALTYVDGRQIYTHEWERQATRASSGHENGFMPRGFSLGGRPPYMVKNVVFATSETVPAFTPLVRRWINNFENIVTENKLVTHAIHFDVNRSEIRTESTTFIADLAQWLKEHPAIKLEIDGHTDNDGDAAANMKLSQERADAVKNQLVAYGINALRLTAKGFGATVPIQPNTTPEGKADNRRVEFVKR